MHKIILEQRKGTIILQTRKGVEGGVLSLPMSTINIWEIFSLKRCYLFWAEWIEHVLKSLKQFCISCGTFYAGIFYKDRYRIILMNVTITTKLLNTFKILNTNKQYKLSYEFVTEVRTRYIKSKSTTGIRCTNLDKTQWLGCKFMTMTCRLIISFMCVISRHPQIYAAKYL